MSAQTKFEVVSPISDDVLVEAVAISMYRAHGFHSRTPWRDTDPNYRAMKRIEASAAIATVFTYFLQLDGAADGNG